MDEGEDEGEGEGEGEGLDEERCVAAPLREVLAPLERARDGGCAEQLLVGRTWVGVGLGLGLGLGS